MTDASIETTNDPSSDAMKRVVQDALDPNRREAIRAAFADLEDCGEEPLHHSVRSAWAGEEITGTVLGADDRLTSLVTERGIIVADRGDLPERLPETEEITFIARSDFFPPGLEHPARESQSQPAPTGQPQQDQNPDLKSVQAQLAAQRGRERDDDDHER